MTRFALLLLALTLAPTTALACRPGVDPDCPPAWRHHHHGKHGGGHSWGYSPHEGPSANPLTPLRAYLADDAIPPDDVGGYGVVALQFKATAATRRKLTMVCRDFVSFFPKSKGSKIPPRDQMVTVWPIEADFVDEAEKDDCAFSLQHYDLEASETAIADARKQGAKLDGEGPFLIGWAPSDTRGVPDKLVLTIDLSRADTQAEIDHGFLFWKQKIVEDPSLWRGGFSLERFRTAVADFADQYGQDILSAIKLVSAKGD